MTKVYIGDRGSLEHAYPPDVFASDAAQNEAVSEIVRGVRVGSAPDADGLFDLEHATRHVGEPETPYFLVPRLSGDHAQFLDDIVTAAKRFGYRADESPGIGDPRLHGLRQ
jgi:hypothetical protein